MQKIHRRKNEEIIKAFVCPQECGKSYGSYSALYTHIKTKHKEVKPPQMKKNKHPHMKEETPPQQALFTGQVDCLKCRRNQCNCVDSIEDSQLEAAVHIMADQTFIKWVNSVHQLTLNQKENWVRNTEQPFEFLDKEGVLQLAGEFNRESLTAGNPISLSHKWVDYLSYSSRFWDPAHLNELYSSIFAIMSRDSMNDIQVFFEQRPALQLTQRCIEQKRKQWLQFVQLVKAI